MPASLDDFADEPGFKFDQPLHEYLGEVGGTGLRFKSKSLSNLASDNIIKSLAAPSGAAFANRYDFGASLDAVKSRKDGGSPKEADTLYMKGNTRGSLAAAANIVPAQTVVVPAPGTALASSSYEELVNKYCFFGAKPASPLEVPTKPKTSSSPEVRPLGGKILTASYQMSPPVSPTNSIGPTVSTVEYVTPKSTLMRSVSPSFTPITGTSPADVALHTQQTPDRFVSATAIRG